LYTTVDHIHCICILFDGYFINEIVSICKLKLGEFGKYHPWFQRRRLGVQAAKKSRRPRRLAKNWQEGRGKKPSRDFGERDRRRRTRGSGGAESSGERRRRELGGAAVLRLGGAPPSLGEKEQRCMVVDERRP
jgi:hypothetical protein